MEIPWILLPPPQLRPSEEPRFLPLSCYNMASLSFLQSDHKRSSGDVRLSSQPGCKILPLLPPNTNMVVSVLIMSGTVMKCPPQLGRCKQKFHGEPELPPLQLLPQQTQRRLSKELEYPPLLGLGRLPHPFLSIL